MNSRKFNMHAMQRLRYQSWIYIYIYIDALDNIF